MCVFNAIFETERETLTRYQANRKNQLRQSLCWHENLEKYHQYSLLSTLST